MTGINSPPLPPANQRPRKIPQITKCEQALVEHKDGLAVLVAVISPLTSAGVAFLAASISYRATITGPRVQKEIAAQQLKTSHEQLRFQRQQAQATLFGAYTQKWVDKFSEKIAEIITSAVEIQRISGDRLPTDKLSKEVLNMLMTSLRSHTILVNEAKFLVNEDDKSEELFLSISVLVQIEGHDVDEINGAEAHSITLARTIIRNRLLSVEGYLVDEKGLSSYAP